METLLTKTQCKWTCGGGCAPEAILVQWNSLKGHVGILHYFFEIMQLALAWTKKCGDELEFQITIPKY
jgi:hypothetical protein